MHFKNRHFQKVPRLVQFQEFEMLLEKEKCGTQRRKLSQLFSFFQSSFVIFLPTVKSVSTFWNL